MHRVLKSLSQQTFKPTEIIIVDSSDIPLLKADFDQYADAIQLFHTNPSVCYQRNFGIQKSTSDYIFLLDDDIEISENYIETLLTHLETHKKETICSGLVLENKEEQWTYCEAQKSNLGLLMAYIFELSVGFDIHKRTMPKGYVNKAIFKTYILKGNSISKAGWPIIIDFKKPDFATPIYGLGASIIRAEKLKKVNFDTVFYKNGIGDNYDLIMSLDSDVCVLTNAKAYHHREKTNRVNATKSYYYRIAALHYILCKHSRFTFVNLIYLIWSLVGNSMLFLAQGKIKMLWYNLEIITRIIFNFPLYKSKK
jgi:glycosyltransferase involved in cell wall biosynthesis